MFRSVGEQAASPKENSQSSNADSLYPNLAGIMAEEEEGEEDILSKTLGIPPAKPKSSKPPPPRPPPPGRSSTLSALPRNQASDKVYVPPLLQPHEVRWFYQEPGKFWQPFGGHDSLRLEQCQLDLMGWGVEGAVFPVESRSEEEEGKEEGREDKDVLVMGDLYTVHVKDRKMEPLYWPIKEKWKVMRACWFEVIGEKWYPFAEADYAIIEKEHVERKWREKAKKDADLQSWALSSRSPSLSSSSRTLSTPSYSPSLSSSSSASSSGPTPPPPQVETLNNSLVIHKLAMDKYDIVWLANGEIYKMKKELTSQLWNKMGQKLGKGALFGGNKVIRGYKDYASGEDRLPPIGHVVFVTHGIGQNMDASSIEQSTKDFREACVKVAKSSFGEQWREKRVEFIPVEWRTGLSLGEGLVNRITPSSLKILRSLVNDCVMDVFYYFSPKFGPEILNSLKCALQQQYDKFIEHNPRFLSNGGTISIIAHSLGSVMLYDILREKCDLDPEVMASIRSSRQSASSSSCAGSRQASVVASVAAEATGSFGDPFSGVVEEGEGLGADLVDGDVVAGQSEDAMREELAELKKRMAYLEQQLVLKTTPKPLSFSIDHFFAFGSPTALFIAMKEYETLVGKHSKSAESFLPACVCKRIHNIQHPSDPIAYRLEPLVHAHYAQVKPVKICSAKGKISQDMVDHAEGPQAEKPPEQSSKSWWANQLQSVGNSLLNMAAGKKAPAAESEPQAPEKMVDSDKQLHESVKLKERLDFTMKESAMENSYFNSITAHYSYWASADCAQYVLLQLYNYKPPS